MSARRRPTKPATDARPPQRRVLVAEDEQDVAELIRYHLTKDGYDVVLAKTGAEALRRARDDKPALILLDIMIPQMNGWEVCRCLKRDAETADIPVIMVSGRVEEGDKVLGFELGADDYVTKPFSPRELIARIQAVIRRRAPQLADELLEVGGLSLDPIAHRVKVHGRNLDLPPAEFRLLRFLMTHPERVYTRPQLLDEIWGDHVFIEERTVDVHIRRLREALEPSGHDRLVETVRGSGYRFRRDLP